MTAASSEGPPPRAAFDGYSASYDQALAAGLSLSGENRDYFAAARVQWMKRCLARRAFRPQRVLDFGCGTGGAIGHLLALDPACTVTGVDVSTESLRVAREAQGSSRVTFVELSGAWAHGGHDLAYCNGVFHHVPPAERPALMAALFRAVRPGGWFSFWENNPWNPGTRLIMSRIPFDRDAQMLSHREAARLLAASGFEVMRTDFLFYFPRALRWLRWIEPALIRLPMGGQYQLLCRRCPSDGVLEP